MTKIADMYVQLSSHGLGNVISSLRQVEQAGQKTEQSMGGRGAGGLLALAANANLAVSGVMAIGRGAIGAGGAILGLAGDAESTAVAFGTLLGSTTKAKALIEEITQFAAATPFELPELTNASKSLLAFGVSAESIKPTLTSIGDIASGIGAPIGEIAELYGKAKVQGTLFSQDINQLTGRGIPIIQQLAKQFGVAESEVKKLVEGGSVKFENLEEAFRSLTANGGQFSGMMAAQSETMLGKWSTFKDALAALGRTVGGALLPMAKSALTTITGFAEKLGGAFTTFFSETVPRIIDNVKFFFENWNIYLAMAGQHVAIFAMNAWERFKTFFVNVGEIAVWFSENWREIFETAWNFVKSVFLNMIDNIKSIWTALLEFFSTGEFSVDWTPLTEGFKNTIKEMPQLTQASLIETTKALESLQEKLHKRRMEFDDRRTAEKQRKAAEEAAALAAKDAVNEVAEGKHFDVSQKDKAKKTFGFTGLAELANMIQQGVMSEAEKKAEKQREQTNKHLAQIAKNTGQPNVAVVAGGTT